MADDDPERKWYNPKSPQPPPRQPELGEEIWRLQNEARRVLSCELRNDERVGAGWNVMLLEDGEPLFSRRCATEEGARFVADVWRTDQRRTRWTDMPTASTTAAVAGITD